MNDADIQSEKPAGKTVRWWHIACGAALALLMTAFAPRGKSPEFSNLSEGSIAQQKVIAPFDFEILKSTEELEKERLEAKGTVLPVVFRVDSVADLYRGELRRFGAESYEMLTDLNRSFFEGYLSSPSNITHQDSAAFVEGCDKLIERFGFRLSNQTWLFLVTLLDSTRGENTEIYRQFFNLTLSGILHDLYSQGIIDVPKEKITHSAKKVVVQLPGEEMVANLGSILTRPEALQISLNILHERFQEGVYPADAANAAYELIQRFIAANIEYNEGETERRRVTAVAKVPLAKGFVKKDELIIDSNIRVTKEHLAKLNSLAIKRAEMNIEKGAVSAVLPIVGQFLLFGIILSLLGLFILRVRAAVWNDWKLIVLLSLIIGFGYLFQVLVPLPIKLSIHLTPVAMAAILLAILIDRAVAMAAVFAMALFTGLLYGNHFSAAFISMVVGVVAIISVQHVQNRADVMRATLYLAVAFAPLILSFHFISFSTTGKIWTGFMLAGANALLSPILALGFVFIFENLFKITTDLSLLELVDLNRPLLQQLAIKSPGTYHHSIMVGSLAEAASRAIGANALLTRAGAYYHDIGKMEHKEYFVENQDSESGNIHDRLPPSKSAELVINHVAAGLKLADEFHLPEQIKAFISEHHGKSKLAYFYSKATREMEGEVSDEPFRYPGPNPQSRETGILMLADVVEAAARSLGNPTVDEITETVDNLIRTRLSEGDLDDCPLTLREIGIIRESFIKVLSGIYHHRVLYPGQKGSDNVGDGN